MQFLLATLLAGLIYGEINFQQSDINEMQPVTDIKVDYFVNGKQKSLDDSCIKVQKCKDSSYDTVISGCRSETSFASSSIIRVKFFAKTDDDPMAPASNTIYSIIYSKDISIVAPQGTTASNELEFEITKATRQFCIKLKQSVYIGVVNVGTTDDPKLEITAPMLKNNPEVEYVLDDLTPPDTVKISTSEGGVEAYKRFQWNNAKKALECCFEHARLRCTPEFRKQLGKLQQYLKCGRERKRWACKVEGCFMSTCRTPRRPGPVCYPEPCPPIPQPCYPAPQPCYPAPQPCYYPPAPQPCYYPPAPQPCYYPPALQPCYPSTSYPSECSSQTSVSIQFLVMLSDNLCRVMDICQQNPTFFAELNTITYPIAHQEYISFIDKKIRGPCNVVPYYAQPQAPIGIVCRSGTYAVDYLTGVNKDFLFACRVLCKPQPKMIAKKEPVRKTTRDRKKKKVEEESSEEEEEEETHNKKKKKLSRGVVIGISCCGGACLIVALCYVGYTLM
ncbi:hypothetical protein THOM_1971 [Trachipleistophora hominis]|uniref:Uncharacterized protein n=1 Tax=Trachipleistophora hominis TaxID=72359 RepID=L7JUI8_TRAHO|nr:hypothetical protein THOM_1971 [Trachipleistophora hominis]